MSKCHLVNNHKHFGHKWSVRATVNLKVTYRVKRAETRRARAVYMKWKILFRPSGCTANLWSLPHCATRTAEFFGLLITASETMNSLRYLSRH